MRNKIIILFLLTLVFSCGSKRSVITKKAKSTKEQSKAVALKNTEDPVANKAVKNPKIVKSKRKAKVSSKVFANATAKYIDTYKAIAQEEMQLYSIPASITIAQGILESGSGKGRLSVEANNHFGIKCHNWTGVKIYHDDDEAQECFRKYNNAKYSFRDHSLFLSGRKRYQDLFKLDPKDYKGWAKGLRAAGYATDKKYPEKLISIIERYQLYKYDDLSQDLEVVLPVKKTLPSKKVVIPKVGRLVKATANKEVETTKTAKPTAIIEEANKLKEAAVYNQPVKVEETYNAPVQETVITKPNLVVTKPYQVIDKVTKHEVVKGDTLYNISKRYNLTVTELKALNNLSNNNIFLGQKLKVSKN